jgi:4-amino-4-deoxy-L-arabinose transferase-like glycosyltransferase
MKDNRVIGADSFLVRLRRELGILLFISVVGLAIRLPFFFPAVINWDESTFIIIGQSAVDGFLPNEIAWDGKPAFLFWWFGGAIALFGKTIPAVRFAGFMWLLLSAYLLYRAAFLITDSRLGGAFAAAMLIVAGSAYSLNVSSEHLALLPMTGSILVLLNNSRRMPAIFLGSILLGFACMFRLNLVYLCFVIGAYLCVHRSTSWETFLNGALKRGALFSFGILTPLLLSFPPYLFTGHSHLWITVYEAAAHMYSDEQRSFARAVVETLHKSSTNLAGVTMWGSAILGAFIIARRWRDLGPERRSDWLMCGAFVVGSFLSIVETGRTYEHYFIQLVPGLSMFAAAAFILPCKAFGLSKADWTKLVFGTVLIVLVIFRTAAAEWSVLAQRFWRGEPLSYGVEYDIADKIRSQGIEDFSLFMMDNHLVYWLLGRYPPTRLATHPSALGKQFVRKYLEPASYTTEDALRSVFRREPTFVVWRPNLGYLDQPSVRFVQQELTNAYVLIGQIGSTQVYRRTG